MWAMMIIMAIPEQLVLLFTYSTSWRTLIPRITVSVAMYATHFGWNGMIPKPMYAYNEVPWILGTALYAYIIVGVSEFTAVSLLAADCLMVLILRGITAGPSPMKLPSLKPDLTENEHPSKQIGTEASVRRPQI